MDLALAPVVRAQLMPCEIIAMPIRQLSRRFLAQLIDALLLIAVAVACFYGTSLSPFQRHPDRIELKPFPLVPFVSAVDVTFDLPADPATDQSSFLSLLMGASGIAADEEGNLLQRTFHWPGGRSTFTLRQTRSLGLFALWLVYATLCIGHWGQTVGKRLVGLRVVRKDGESVRYVRAFARALAYAPCAVVFIAIAWVLFGVTGRWWHDWGAGTRVVDA